MPWEKLDIAILKKNIQVYKLWVIILKPDSCCYDLNMKWGFNFNMRD